MSSLDITMDHIPQNSANFQENEEHKEENRERFNLRNYWYRMLSKQNDLDKMYKKNTSTHLLYGIMQ